MVAIRGGKVLGHGVPDLVEIQGEVRVDQPVAHADDLWPWDLRELTARLRGHSRGRLADNLDALDQSKCSDPIVVKIGADSTLDRGDRLSGRIQLVLQSDPVRLVHTGSRQSPPPLPGSIG
jgi:hypothetical protein